MPLNLRSTALAAAVCDAGIRVYTRTSDGDVREGCNDLSLSALNDAKSRNDRNVVDMADGWQPGELRFKCSPDSTLCCYAWPGDRWSQSIFYQTEDGVIRERRYLNFAWQVTDFVQPNCMMGTSITVVGEDARVVVLFFQDSEGYLCFRPFRDLTWQPVVRLHKAVKCTGIGAISWNSCNNIRVYIQDEDNVIREYCGSHSTDNWTHGNFSSPCTIPIGDIAAVAWEAFGLRQIILYFQDESCDIVQWGTSLANDRWTKSPVFVHPALPNSDIVVYVRQPGPGFYSVVMWAGSDQVLYQRVGPAYWGWMDITPIAFLQATGRFMGKFIGKPFTDNTSKSDQRVIKQVNVRSGTLIDAISLDFTNGSSTGWHGGSGGNLHSFPLDQEEDVTHILVTADSNTITALQFITSNGRKSDWFGNQTGKNFSWELNGRALGGFLGAEQQYVQGLMPFWSERYSKATLTNLESCTIEAAKIRQDIETARTRCTTLRIQTDTLQRAISSSLRAPADHAIQGMMVLSGSIEDLYNQTKMAVLAQKEEVDKLVKLCKDQALVVHKRFQTLYNQSDSLRQQGGNLSTELTAQLGASDSTAARLKNLQEVAEGLKASSEAKAATLQNRKETAEQSLVKAQDTKREAEKKRDSAKKARIVRDIFTFGLGEIGDWGDLNKAIDYANKLVESCQRDLQAANEDIQQAAANLSQVEAEITAFSNLNSTFSPLRGELESIRVLAIALKDKNQELTNKAFDISIFLGGLVARTETMPTKLTAAQFAKAILAVEQLLVTPTQVKGLIWDHPEQLESTMEMIADSDEVADDLGDMI